MRVMGKTVSLTRMTTTTQDMSRDVASARFVRSGGDNMQALGEALAPDGRRLDPGAGPILGSLEQGTVRTR